MAMVNSPPAQADSGRQRRPDSRMRATAAEAAMVVCPEGRVLALSQRSVMLKSGRHRNWYLRIWVVRLAPTTATTAHTARRWLRRSRPMTRIVTTRTTAAGMDTTDSSLRAWALT